MSSRQEELGSAAAQSREAAREITHERTERARVVSSSDDESKPADKAEATKTMLGVCDSAGETAKETSTAKTE